MPASMGRHKLLTNIDRTHHIPAIDSMRSGRYSLLDAPLDLEAQSSSLHSLLVNPALPLHRMCTNKIGKLHYINT